MLMLLFCLLSTAGPVAEGIDVAALDAMARESFPADEPGASVLIKKGDQVILRKGYGMADLELQVAADRRNSSRDDFSQRHGFRRDDDRESRRTFVPGMYFLCPWR